MSKNYLSKHIPDITYMSMIAESRKSWLHKFSPWSKLFYMFLGIILLIVINNLNVIIISFFFILVIYISARLPLKKLMSWYLIPFLISLTIAIPLTFNEPGTNYIFNIDLIWFSISLTEAGFRSLLLFVLRALASVTISFIFIMTTKYKEIAYIMYKIFPKKFANIMLLVYRYIFLMMDEIAGRITALKIRGGTLLRYTVNLRNFGNLIASSIIIGIDRSTRLAKAIELRGGGNEAIYVNETIKKPGFFSYIIIILLIILIIAILLFGFENCLNYVIELFTIR